MSKIVSEELDRIAAAHGGILLPADVVESARPEHSPLHRHFTWDDGEAARRYRLDEAARLIRITVTLIGNDNPVLTRCWVSLTTERAPGGGGYRPIAVVLSTGSMRDQLIRDVSLEVRQLKRKYHALAELRGAFEHLERAAAQLGEGTTEVA